MRCGGPATARMAATDGQIVCAAARWADEAQYLRELAGGPRPLRLPAVVKVTRGQYAGLGVPSLPAPALQPAALLVSAGRRRKLAAQAVKLKEGGRMAAVGPRLAIPETYPGYFELLSEEGRAVRCIEGVGELSRRAGLAGACLVREAVRAFPDPGPGPAVAAVAALPADTARTVPVGETLTPTGEVTVGKSRYLRCVDGRGESLLVPLEQRGGRFSAVAREDSISGVHSARNLLAKRLPLTVRLVHGPPPAAAHAHAHSGSGRGQRHFAPELRLLAAYEEEHVFALPLGGHHRTAAAAAADHQLIALPLAAPLKLVRARNEDALRGMHEFVRLAERAARLLADVADKMQVLDGKLGDPKALRLLSSGQKSKPSSGHLLRRSASSDSANLSHHRDRDRDRDRDRGHDENRCPPPPAALADEYDEIDQIYDYVRGFAPLPKNIRSPFADPQPAPADKASPTGSPPLSPTSAPGHLAPLAAASPPEPPPIETIPTKKMQHHKAEKRTRRKDKEAGAPGSAVKEKSPSGGGGGGGLYIKHGGGAAQLGRQLLHRQKSASANANAGSRPGSPPLGVRYKSLSNLQQAMEVDGTLDSSHSGGRTSGDSGAGAKLPEKRSRRLSRPRSLTNLVWELRGGDKGHAHPPPTAAPQLPAAVPTGAAVGRKPKLSLGGGGGSSHKRLGTLYL